MKFRFLILLLLSAFITEGQIASVIASSANNKTSSSGFSYTQYSGTPTFSSPATVTDAIGSSLESNEVTGGVSDILIAENATPNLFNNRLRPNGISNRRFKSAGTTRVFIGGDNVTAGQQVIAPLNGADNLQYFHLGIVGNSSLSVTGISGLNHLASVTGSSVKGEDLVIKDVEFAGCQINESTSGEKYSSITLNYVRVFGYSQEGEGFYIGSTNKLSNFSTIDLLIMNHCYAANKGRDGLQITHVADARIENGTIYDVGKANITAQRLLLQVHNSNGYIKKWIFHKAPEPANIFTHGFTFEDCYFEWDTNNPIYLGRLKSSEAFGESALAANGQPIVFRRCVFAPSVNVTNLIRILETDCNIIFEDCIFSDRISNIISDERPGGATNTISNIRYTIVPASSIPSPTYSNHSPDDAPILHGLVTSIYHYLKHMGFRTP